MSIDDILQHNLTKCNKSFSFADSVDEFHGDPPLRERTCSPDERDRQQRQEILAAADRGDCQKAIALLDDLLSRHPDSAMDYNNRGLMYFQWGDFDAALADYNRALSLEPRLDGAYNNRANCYVARGQLGEAIADYQIALDFNPGNLRVWINQGITYRDLGLYDLALENFDIALILGKRLKGRIYGERGRTYHLRGDWNGAIADYNRAIEILPNNFSSRRYKKQVLAWRNELFEVTIA